jgi:hypothetical protein
MKNLFLPYNLTVLKLNIIYSIVLTIFSGIFLGYFNEILLNAPPPGKSLIFRMLLSFVIWLLTGGFFLAAYYFEVARKNEYYFYYNIGLSKLKLLFVAWLLHLILVVPLIYILSYV